MEVGFVHVLMHVMESGPYGLSKSLFLIVGVIFAFHHGSVCMLKLTRLRMHSRSLSLFWI